MRRIFVSFVILVMVSITLDLKDSIVYAENPELQVVPHLDLEVYQGTWFEIAHNPWFVEKNCFAMITHYKFTSEGKIKITNVCRKHGFNGKISKMTGKGWVVDPETQAKLKVQFIWPFNLDYWVIDLGEDYQYAVVGEPDRENIWILSRKPDLNKDLLSRIIKNIQQKGYDTSKLIWTPQHRIHSQCLAQWVEAPEEKPENEVC